MVAGGSDLAAALRAWRDRLSPGVVGLPSGGVRRSPGLRREELAALAGVSVDYLVRLEQGRAAHPSPQVLGALSRSLRLSIAERDLLHRLAGAATPTSGVVSHHVGPGVQRILDRLEDTPVCVFSAAWDLLLANRMWAALLGDTSGWRGRERSLVWRTFSGAGLPLVQTPEERERFQRELVADLHDVVVRYPADAALAELMGDLRSASAEFRQCWEDYTVEPRRAEQKTVASAAVGQVVLDCDVLTVPGADLRLVVYTAEPGSVAAGQLDLLRVSGLQA